jgi:hypothetical protein
MCGIGQSEAPVSTSFSFWNRPFDSGQREAPPFKFLANETKNQAKSGMRHPTQNPLLQTPLWAVLTGVRPFSGPPLPFCLPPVIAARPIVLSIGAESPGWWGCRSVQPDPGTPSPISVWPHHGRNPGSWKFQKHKNLKNFSNLFGTKKKVVGKGRFGLVGFLPEDRKWFWVRLFEGQS